MPKASQQPSGERSRDLSPIGHVTLALYAAFYLLFHCHSPRTSSRFPDCRLPVALAVDHHTSHVCSILLKSLLESSLSKLVSIEMIYSLGLKLFNPLAILSSFVKIEKR